MDTITCVQGDTIEVGGNVWITILAVDGDEVIFEIESPDDRAVEWHAALPALASS